ncbi:Regulatory sensor-transducer, BlaR1/MecR1 family / Ankyrin-related protein [Caulobacter sp. RHG1]|nr:M56 family metallopeptidase [Caulobacter sp. RHG1]NQE64266.1 Regulatory sensor-transducer, BlaR1/MecR1 family / Ankyrin-related protein [Caulobacter sp. RHG1]
MMASELAPFLLKANLAVAAAVLLVLALRRPVRAAFGARSAYALWLVLPLSILALLIPARTVVIPFESAQASPIAQAPSTAAPATAAAQAQTPLPWAEIALSLWALVALGGLAIQAERQRRFVRSLGRLSAADGLLWSDRPGVGPAVIGALAPRVVLPADFAQRFTAQEQALILAHEQNHLAVGDAQINALVTGLQCLFWFNPMIHLGAAALRIDQEIACDAAVLARHPKTRRAYGEAMLKTQQAACAPPLGCHWPASANQQLKERFTMLSRHHAHRGRHLAGAAAVALLGLSAGVAAWAAQPAQVVQQSPQQASRAIARHLGQPLFDAVRARDLAAVQELLALGANANAVLPGDGSPLIEAARRGESQIVQALLTAGADPNLAVRGDGAPLIQASISGHLDIVQALVARGANVEIFVPGDETPLINAAQAGRLDIVTYLVERGADVNRAVQANPGEMRSPLSQAQKNGHGAVVNYLKARGARS